ncbi:FAD-binding protein [Tistrella bauzanensis]|uniref:FAD-binding protein n=1 Tax=Tistrella bauzanensis TaxID=657419 RepID=UPI00355905A2
MANGLSSDLLAGTLIGIGDPKTEAPREAFWRNFADAPQLFAPYCAVKVTGALLLPQGGPAIETQAAIEMRARLLGMAGAALPNLHAAGDAAVGVSGADDHGSL